MGAMLLILFGNNLLPLAAMTLNSDGDCQMACCRAFRHHKKNSSGDSCPLMNKENGSHEMAMVMMAEMQGEKNAAAKKLEIKNFENIKFDAKQLKIPR